MKNKGRLFYLLVCLVLMIFLIYKGIGYMREISSVKREKSIRQETIMKNIDEKYCPRSKDFFKKGDA